MEQLDLFSSLNQQPSQPELPPRNKEAIAILGLQYIEDYIDEHQHDWLLTQIDKQLA